MAEMNHDGHGNGGHSRESRRGRMLAALALTTAFFVIELVGGFLSGSLALIADAAHMFTDVGALILAFAAMTVADRAPARKYTFGFQRLEILAAFVNAEVLVLVSASSSTRRIDGFSHRRRFRPGS